MPGTKYLPLILAGLWRKPLRSVLTWASILVAFLLFGLLEGINAGFAEVIAAEPLDRLFTDPRVPGGAPMPLAAADKIRRVPGVTKVCFRAGFYGHYQDPRNGMYAIATDAADWLSVRPEFFMAPEQLETFRRTRDAIAMTPAQQQRLGLKLGDRVPIHSPIARKDGNPVWTFELVATLDRPEDPGKSHVALINYAYFDEARLAEVGTVDRVIVRIADPSRSAQTAAAIDQLFANSAHETRTQNEREETESSIRQLGEIAYFTTAIVAATFFALLFVTGNTMAQSARERIPEFAVLQTLGFPTPHVLALIVAESMFLCVLAAAAGLGVAALLFPNLQNYIGIDRLSWRVVAFGLLFAALLAIVSALLPAWKVRRLRIVEALRVV